MTPLVVLLAARAAFQSVGTDRTIALTHVTLIDGRGAPALGGVIYRPQDILNSSGRAKRKDR
jgi:hypothetical protein